MRHGNYNTSHRHRNLPTHPRRHHDPQPRNRNRNRNLPLPRPFPRPNQLNELELQLSRLEHVPPSPPAEAAFPREIEENTEELESRIRPREAQLRLGCDLCRGTPIISFDDLYRAMLGVPCPFICICHQITDHSDDGDDDDDESDDDENDDDESDDEDEDYLLTTREIIREYLQNRDYSVINLGKEEEEEGEKRGGGEICVVCFEEMEGKEVFKRLDCGHNFHEECITKWLLRKNSCPMCVSAVIPPNLLCPF